jgi:hypothetical protein
MGAEKQRSPAADRAAAVTCSLAKASTTENSTQRCQVYDTDGHRLPPRRPRLIPGAPRRASPSWYRLAADRWVEVAR